MSLFFWNIKWKILLGFFLTLQYTTLVDGQCYKIDPLQSDFISANALSTNLTLESATVCVEICTDLEFAYAALQEASYCFCGMSTAGFTTDTTCTYKCADGSDCGGEDVVGSVTVLATGSVGASGGYISMTTTADKETVVAQVAITVTVNASANYTIDWGDGSTFITNDTDHTYALPGFYYVVAYLESAKQYTSTMWVRVHDSPVFTLDCPTMLKIAEGKECGVTSYRQGYDYTVSWNMTNATHAEGFTGKIPAENIGTFGSASESTDTLSDSTITAGTLVILQNSENQEGELLVRFRGTFSSTGSIAVYAITPVCSSNSFCGRSQVCSSSCLAAESPLTCGTEFCSLNAICQDTCSSNAAPGNTFTATFLTTIQVTATAFEYDLVVPAKVPAGVKLAIGCDAAADCPSPAALLKTRPLGPIESAEEHFTTSSGAISIFSGRHIAQVLIRGDAQFNLNFTIMCTEAAPFPKSNVPTPYDDTTEQYVYKGSLALVYSIYSDIATFPPKIEKPGICQEEIGQPVLFELWMKFGEPYENYPISFPQGSSLYTKIEFGNGTIFYDYMDYATDGFTLLIRLEFPDEGLFFLDGNTTNAIGNVLYNATIHVVPPVTDTWTAQFTCPCLDSEEGFKMTLSFPSAAHPPWNATFNATYDSGTALFNSELLDFGTVGGNGAAQGVTRIMNAVILKEGFYTVKIMLQNEVSNATINVNVTVMAAIRNVTGSFYWDNQGTQTPGMGTSKNIFMANNTIYIYPSCMTGIPDKWRLRINDTGEEFETTSASQNFTHIFDKEGTYTVIISGYNSVQGWVNSTPMTIVVVNQIKGFTLTDDNVIRKPNEDKYVAASFEQFTPMSCISIDYGDGSPYELFGDVNVCRKKYPDLEVKGPITSIPMQMLHKYANAGTYSVMAKAHDDKLYEEFAVLSVLIGDVPCTMPVVQIVDGVRVIDSPSVPEIRMTFYKEFDTKVEFNCTTEINFKRWWSIIEVDSTTGEAIRSVTVEGILVSWNVSAIVIPPRFLPPGLYKLKFAIDIVPANTNSHLQREDFTFLRVTASPICPVIISGSAIKVKRGFGQFVNLEPGLSYDPDYPDSKTMNKTVWCRQILPTNDGEFPVKDDGSHVMVNPHAIPDPSEVDTYTGEGCFGRELGVILLPNYVQYQMDTLSFEYPVGTYEYLLEIEKAPRRSYTTLQVEVVLDPLPIMDINCTNNLCIPTVEGLYFNPSTRLALLGLCLDSCGIELDFYWGIRARNGEPISVASGCVAHGSTTEIQMENSDCDEAFLTPSNQSSIALSTWFFANNSAIDEFIFSLTGVTEKGYEGSTEILLKRNKPPTCTETCDLTEIKGGYTSSCVDPIWIDPEGMGVATYSYYYFKGGVKQTIITTVKSVIDLTLPVGTYELFVDVTDVIGAYTTRMLRNITITVDSVNFDPVNWENLAAKDTKSLWMALMQYPSIRDSATDLSLDPNDIGNLTDAELLERISKIADLNSKALELLLNTSSFSTMGEINSGASILQSIMAGIFKNELGAQTIDMHGRETFLKILQKMVDQIPNVGNKSPRDLEPFMANILDVMCAGIEGINKNLAELSDCPPTDMRVADEMEYDGNLLPNTYVPLNADEMYCKNVKDTIKYNSKQQIDQMFNMLDDMSVEVMKLCAPGENFKANAPNGAAMVLACTKEKVLENGLTIATDSNEKAMNASTQFPKNFCPSKCIIPDTDCNQFLGLRMVIWPCITHVYPDTSKVLSNSTRVIDVDVIINGNKVSVVNQTSDIIIKIPRLNDSIEKPPVIVNASDEINNLTRFVYHTFNVSYSDSSFTMEFLPKGPIDDKLVLVIDYERMPTPSKYWSLTQITVNFRKHNSGFYSFFVGSVENKNRTGRFFIGIAMLKDSSVLGRNLTKDDFQETFNLQYQFKAYSSGCYYFDPLKAEWAAKDLYVVETTPTLITCSTKHLTPFGFGYMPTVNMIDFEYVFAHAGFIDNLTLYLVLIIVTTLYILFLLWAFYQDRQDLKLRGVIPLPDNDPKDKYLYELTFSTGPDAEATTDSNIYIILSGEYGETEVRRLPPAQNKLYRRFGIDSFVMATPRPLGPLLYLRVFHDNSGEPPLDGWQLQMVVVRDLQLKEKYIFDTNAWLAFYKDEGKLDKTFTPYEGKDEKTFSQNMYIRSNKAANQDHMWMSIFVRPIGSRYSRKERVSASFSFLYLSMLVDAIWYNGAKESRRNSSFDLGPFSFSYELVLTALFIVLVVYPIIYILILIFKRARPRNLKKCRALDSIEKQRREQYENIDGNLSEEDSRINVEIDGSKERQPKDKSYAKCIPWWTRIIAWIIALAAIGAGIFFVWSYGIMWGEIKTVKWFSSFIITFIISILITQWLKVAIHGLFSSCTKSDLSAEDVDCDEELPGLKLNEEWQYARPMDPTYRKKVHRVIGVDIENPETAKIKERMQKEYEMKYVIRGIGAYAVFLAIVMILGNGRTDPNALLLKKHFENSFIVDKDIQYQFVNMIKSTTDWWMWAKFSVIQKLRAQRYYNGDPPYGLRGFLDDKVNRIMGYAIMRQIRSKRYNCEVPPPMDEVVEHCSGGRGLINEETQTYCAGWIFNESFPGACDWEEFKYKTAYDLGTFPFSGRLGTYGGGGYIIRLSGNINDIVKRFDQLQQNSWVDQNTRAIFLEFTVFNANVNLFTKCLVLAEFNEGGGIIPKWRFEGVRLIKDPGIKGFITTLCEIAFVAATLFFTLRELWEIKKLKMKYFSSYWNIAELLTIAVSYLSIGLYIYRTILTQQALDEFNKTNGNGYVRMDSAVYIDNLVSIVFALIVFVSTLKLIKLLQFNKRMDVLALTIRRCWDDLKIFFVAFGIIFFAFSCLFFFMFTPFLEEFARLIPTIQTTFAMMLGKFDFQAMKEVNYFSPLLFFVFSLINAMILVNVMLTIILQAFNEVKLDLANIDNRLNVIDFVWTSFKRFARTDNLPKINVVPNLNDREGKLSDRPLEDRNADHLPDKVSMLLRYINDMYFDGRLDLNDPYAKRTLMGGPMPKMLPFQDPNSFGRRKITNSEDT